MRTGLNVDTAQWPEVWKAAYRILEHTIVPNQLQAWIQPLEFVDSGMDTQDSSGNGRLKIRLAAPNDFSAQWVRDHYRRTIETAFGQVMGAECELHLFVKDEGEGEKQNRFGETSAEGMPMMQSMAPGVMGGAPSGGEVLPGVVSAPASHSHSHAHGGSGVRVGNDNASDPRYVFQNFVVGNSNQFAHASAVAVAEHPARQYNPLFIYSPPGLGKTHLLHAIGNHFIARRPNAKVAYLSAEKFVNELIECVQHQRMSQFRAKYRDSYEMILIDDIQFLAGKTRSEEEFFHTFDALYRTKRQIVITSDRPPKEIDGLEERVRTRFEWGLVVDIIPPEIETRIAILKAKAEKDDIYLPEDVATFLATHIKTNIRELEGVLIRLQAHSSLTGAEISIEMAKQELRTVIPEEGSFLTVESIQNAVAKHFGLKPQDLKAATRVRNIALPRQIAMYLIRKYTGLGLKEIGQFFGGKDHSTIVHGCRKIESELEVSGEVRDAVESIQNLL